MKLHHSTTFSQLFEIWKSGELTPQPFQGGDSTATPGEKIIFCFSGERYFLMGMDVTLHLPEGTPAREGECWSWDYDYDGEMVQSPVEKEFHVFHHVALSSCSIELHDEKIPSAEDLLWESDGDTATIWSEKNQIAAAQFVEWLLKKREKNEPKNN